MPRLPVLLLLFSCCFACQSESSDTTAIDHLAAGLREKYAPDRRTDRLDYHLEVIDNGPPTLKGVTTVPEVGDSLASIIRTRHPQVAAAIRVLPDTAVGNLTAGIIRVSVANLRSEPGHSQELATQALLGTPVEVLDKRGNWFLVRTPDRYLAWLDPGAFSAMTPAAATDWLTADLRRFAPATGLLTAMPGGGAILSDLVAGNLLQLTDNTDKAYSEVRLPDGTTGWVPTEALRGYRDWQRQGTASPQDILSTAANLAGRPYLWGGTSAKGMDCSGFTKTAYYLQGLVIPRDASQQVHAGEEVPLTQDLANLRAGDLLFFGNLRDDGSQRITHVGFYLGEGRFLHAGADNGRIAENSLREGDPLFAPHRLNSLLRAKRLSPGTKGVATVEEAFAALLN